ncbi:mercury resistance operon repressor MerR [Ktedonobacter sp. SOSP1-52]|uniref:ArsR/SmtB family transcription factor n=1 Tax=Ktedonobacter sp. SOSP1-52 TaxID=2778366 RepID=UPI001915D4DE|nr:metalloregulator ArsR/SmtB family transcription factor [Ktedonobacter sp. SOSP1-52]GHO68399.1 mercury resistance operon repressor MerR [Ktedonobacter sp. SOSP1-52]
MPTLQAQAIALKAKLYRGFADSSRLSILEALREGALTVSAIVEKTGLSRTNVSNHLRCLSDCDLVTSEAQGRYTLYQLSHPQIAALLTLTEEILRDIARGMYECTNYTEEHPSFQEKESTDE